MMYCYNNSSYFWLIKHQFIQIEAGTFLFEFKLNGGKIKKKKLLIEWRHFNATRDGLMMIMNINICLVFSLKFTFISNTLPMQWTKCWQWYELTLYVCFVISVKSKIHQPNGHANVNVQINMRCHAERYINIYILSMMTAHVYQTHTQAHNQKNTAIYQMALNENGDGN